MKPNRTTPVAIVMALLIAPADAAKPSAPSATLATAQVRIDVDASGRVTAVEPTTPLPQPVVDALRGQAAGWTFEAPTRDGRPVAGTTYARMSVCAAPSPETGGLALAIGDVQNGPGMDARMLRPSFFPPLTRAMVDLGRFDVDAVYEVGVDGRASVVSVEMTPSRPAIRRQLEGAFGKWLAPMRFEPERLDGEAVVTRMRLPVTFTFEKAASPPSQRELQRRVVDGNPTCQALLRGQADGDKPQVALDSPFRLQPAG